MKALSMMQPYAWLFANGYLKIDDRTWSTLYRGPIAIHASKGFHEKYYEFIKRHTNWPLPRPIEFEHGGVVGIATLTDCVEPTAPIGSRMTSLDIRRAHFGAPGHYGFVLDQPRLIDFVRIRGNRGLFDIPDRLLPTASSGTLDKGAEATG
jgi:hypothetical protein